MTGPFNIRDELWAGLGQGSLRPALQQQARWDALVPSPSRAPTGLFPPFLVWALTPGIWEKECRWYTGPGFGMSWQTIEVISCSRFCSPTTTAQKNHQLKAYTDYQQNISTKSSLWSRNATWKVDHNEQLWAYILFLKFWSFFQQVTELWENGMLQPRFRAGRTDSPWMAKSLQQLGRKVAPVGHWVPTKAKEAEQRW